MGVRSILVISDLEGVVEPAPRADQLRLHLHLGTAFGAGSHPTTSGCLSILGGLYGEKAPRPRRVLDVGTGTGVLSIAAALLGAEEVLGIDIDPEAVEIAKGNAEANGAAAQCRFDVTPVTEVPGTFDLVMANFPGADLALQLAEPLCARAQGGLLLVSGFGQRIREGVLSTYQARGRVLRADVVNGVDHWTTFLWG